MIGVLTGMLLIVATALPAAADVRTFEDSRTDNDTHYDIWSVTVDNATANRDKVRVVIRQARIPPPPGFPGLFYVYVDIRGGNPGPEYVAIAGQDFVFYRTEGWGRRTVFQGAAELSGTPTTTGPTSRSRELHEHAWEDPHLSSGQHLRDVQDWAKARRTFYPWVLR